jgi:hypothetical protein
MGDPKLFKANRAPQSEKAERLGIIVGQAIIRK